MRLIAVLALTLAAAAALAVYAARGSAPPDAQKRTYAVRGIYGRDQSRTGFDTQAALGFTAMDAGPYPDQLRALRRRGLTGVVWLGPYSNDTCSFEHSDAWVRRHVSAVAGSPAIAAYFIDDEPDGVKCPHAPEQFRARSALVKRIDPRPPTLMVTYHVDQLQLFAHTVDVIGLDHYPCSIQHGCDYSKIVAEAAEADRLGIRYWGVIQAYGDEWYKLPTPEELHMQFSFWRSTRMEGYLVFAWRWPPGRPGLWLSNHPQLQTELARDNAG